MKVQRSVAAVLALVPSMAAAGERRAVAAPPSEVFVASRTFFDFGPPFEFFALFSVRESPGGTTIERLLLTPEGLKCISPPTLETTRVDVDESMTVLLDGRNPCAIPEKALRSERARKKHGPVFSGVDVVMQVRCGRQLRRLRMDVLDRDLYDAAPDTPEHTSWTMRLLKRLNAATGPDGTEKPIVPMPAAATPADPAPPSAAIEALRRGDYDVLFEGDVKVSALYLQTLQPVPQPTIELVGTQGPMPSSRGRAEYPEIARYASVEGDVGFSLVVTPEGKAAGLRLVSGPPLLFRAVEAQASAWTFPAEATGKTFEGTVRFRLNCPVSAPRSPGPAASARPAGGSGR